MWDCPVTYAIKLMNFYKIFHMTTYGSARIVSCRPLWREKCGGYKHIIRLSHGPVC